MNAKLLKLPADTLAALHAAASDLNDLIEKESAVDINLRFLVSELMHDIEDALATVDPLVDRQPVIVVTEYAQVQ